MNQALIQTFGLTKEFLPNNRRLGAGLVAVDHVSLEIHEGEVFGIVGESGSGKSTLARCIFGITPPTGGLVKLFGEAVAGQSRKDQRKMRSKLGLVFQDPVASLNPRMRIRDVIAEPMHLHTKDDEFIESRVLTLIDRVGLSPNYLDRRAHQLSGGQCQRVAIARALSTNPKAILLDEPTSSLDLSVQAQILNLLEDLRKEFSLTYFLISHNLDVISHLSDRIAVMSAGKIVEMGATSQVIESPSHPFTKALLGAYSGSSSKRGLEVPNFDLDTWQDPPLNRWSFQHVSEFIKTEEIYPSDEPHIWSVSLDSSLEGLSFDLEEQSVSLPNLLTELCTDSFLVAKNGQIVMEKYFNGMTGDTPHLLQSVSKSVLGAVMAQLVEEKVVDLTMTLGQYLPELKGSGYFNATVQDALDMTVAVKFSEEYSDPDSEIQRLDRAGSWRHRLPGDPEGIQEFIKSIKKKGEHGVQFQYCSANTDLLAWLISRITQQTYAQAVSDRIWKPMGAKNSASITIDDHGDALANGGISATTRDLALMGQLMLNGGQMDGRRVIPQNWLEDTKKGAPKTVTSVDYMQSLHPGGSYRNQWWITNGANHELYGVGIYGQYLWIDPTTNLVIMKFSTLPLATSSEHSRKHMALFKGISSALK